MRFVKGFWGVGMCSSVVQKIALFSSVVFGYFFLLPLLICVFIKCEFVGPGEGAGTG
jgi:hypothetical protein